MIDIVRVLSELDESNDIHMARLLVLIDNFSDFGQDYSISGLTKLAKLDFLLRYPVLLERALIAKNKSTKNLIIEDFERFSVESKMVRYRFGPWDHRYRFILNNLTARGLVKTMIEGKTIIIQLTESGHQLAQKISDDPIFQPYAVRSSILRRNFDLSATNLMKFIYDTFPEVISLRSNEVIK